MSRTYRKGKYIPKDVTKKDIEVGEFYRISKCWHGGELHSGFYRCAIYDKPFCPYKSFIFFKLFCFNVSILFNVAYISDSIFYEPISDFISKRYISNYSGFSG